MASYPITKEQLVNASLDAKALEKVTNEPAGSPNPGFADGTVTTRSVRVYDTLATAVAKIGQSGGPFG